LVMGFVAYNSCAEEGIMDSSNEKMAEYLE
jgi:hypothetical protein